MVGDERERGRSAGRDDVVQIERSGQARPHGQAATLRMQARSGAYAILPSPPDVVLMRQLDAEDARPCLMGGEIGSAGLLCDIVSFIGHCGWRGELVVYHGTDHRSIYFDQGHVVGARSTVVPERLGEVLYRHGVLSRDQVDQCSEATVDGKLRFGEAAVKAGLIAREPLFRLMARQAEAIVFGALLVDRGAYYFLESFDEAQLSSLEQLPVGQLVREGVRRMHEARFFRARIPSARHVPVRVPTAIPPQADPLGVYAMIDGERSVADLCRDVGHDEFEVTRVVFQLVQSGHVSVRPPRVPPREAVGLFNEAIALVLRELDALDEGDEVRGLLALFVAGRPWTPLVGGAGPSDDGTLDAAIVEQNVAASSDPATSEQALRTFLYEYASYALFLARPHLKRLAVAPSSKRRVSLQVTSILEPIAPGAPEPDPAGNAE